MVFEESNTVIDITINISNTGAGRVRLPANITATQTVPPPAIRDGSNAIDNRYLRNIAIWEFMWDGQFWVWMNAPLFLRTNLWWGGDFQTRSLAANVLTDITPNLPTRGSVSPDYRLFNVIQGNDFVQPAIAFGSYYFRLVDIGFNANVTSGTVELQMGWEFAYLPARQSYESIVSGPFAMTIPAPVLKIRCPVAQTGFWGNWEIYRLG